jgi:hypothetical protein
MGTEMLMPNNRERTIDALARNNSIIKNAIAIKVFKIPASVFLVRMVTNC